jgi:hypothetical protein
LLTRTLGNSEDLKGSPHRPRLLTFSEKSVLKLPKVSGLSEFETGSIGYADRGALRKNCLTQTQFVAEQGQSKSRGTGL